MNSQRPFFSLCAALAAAPLLAAALPAAVRAQAADAASLAAPQAITSPTTREPTAAALAADHRWDESLAAFAAADRANPPAPGGVLFVGSSSIRLWNGLETEFRSLPVVVKRGFGGSRMLDCTRHLRQLVEPYRPRLVLVYAGDNDLAEGRTPRQVLQSFAAFVEGVRQSLPATRIAYISIKPSPARAALMPSIRETNDLIRAYTLQTRNTDFIDVYTPMLDTQGRPRPELFREDALHLNAAGYDLWKRVISAHLN
ncbi:SGNH/GDSL hydrolase family protein [Bordetella genomosp. 9]|uniref:GDSL family lipase n=1 Tax=Bordetella genomosp. 9 TaxID=1416803 RepID=A0A1W6YWN6_9BORD|nr:SGNH/GDSL hydrolase family protein [Bordetella genomosp. 9]ARP85490.1 GDSL family lipase [Bordetella genomosp. 9]